MSSESMMTLESADWNSIWKAESSGKACLQASRNSVKVLGKWIDLMVDLYWRKSMFWIGWVLFFIIETSVEDEFMGWAVKILYI